MKHTPYTTIIRLRRAVGAAGELAAPPWWTTQFLSPTGLKYLERLFPRTAARAAIESVSEVAGRDHDQSVGARAYHLYRLPGEIERRLAEEMANPDLMASLPLLHYQLDAITAELKEFARDISIEVTAGPKSLGTAEEDHIVRPNTLRRLAASYQLAVEKGCRIYPYFEEGA